MSSQSSYIFNSDYGFNKNEVFYTGLSAEAQTKKDAVRAELKKLPFVESVGFAQNAIGTSDGYNDLVARVRTSLSAPWQA